LATSRKYNTGAVSFAAEGAVSFAADPASPLLSFPLEQKSQELMKVVEDLAAAEKNAKEQASKASEAAREAEGLKAR